MARHRWFVLGLSIVMLLRLSDGRGTPVVLGASTTTSGNSSGAIQSMESDLGPYI